MANDEGLPSASSKETLRSLSPDEALTSNEAVNNVQKRSSLCPDVKVVAAGAVRIQEPNSLSPASKVTEEAMSVSGQNAEAKSDDEDETTVIKLFGVVIKTTKPKKSEISSMMIRGSSSTSTSRNGKEIGTSTTVIINDESPQYYSNKRKIFIPMEQNVERGQELQGPVCPFFMDRLNPREGPGTIRKRLTRSDVDQSCRLLIGKQDMDAHVLPYLTEDQIAMARTLQGLPVEVWDVDNGVIYHLALKQWKTGSFVLTGNWVPHFVQRKNLKVGDTIELVWHTTTPMFLFRVSARSHDAEASTSKAHGGGKEK